MVQRDIIKDQIDQLGKALGKVLVEFLGLKSRGGVLQGIEYANEALQSEVDLNIKELLEYDVEKLHTYLSSRQFNQEALESLAQYLEELGEYHLTFHPDRSFQQYQQAWNVYDYLDSISTVYSMDRQSKKEAIQLRLGQFGK